VAPGVQIRRACISLEALQAMMTAWSSALHPGSHREHAVAPVVYVFRVRPGALRSGSSGALMWAEWAARLRARGGGVLAHIPTVAPSTVVSPAIAMPLDQPRQRTVREPSDGEASAYSVGSVRLLTLSAGRIVSALRPTDIR
jgi:hypothetical protein